MLKRHAACAILEGELDLEALLDRVAGKRRQASEINATTRVERVVPVELKRLPVAFKREMLDLAEQIEAWQRDHPEAAGLD